MEIIYWCVAGTLEIPTDNQLKSHDQNCYKTNVLVTPEVDKKKNEVGVHKLVEKEAMQAGNVNIFLLSIFHRWKLWPGNNF